MSIYPTLTDLCGIPTPKHVQGESIRALLADPRATWDKPAVTTYKFMNHAIRTEGWRLIRYADGGEELYNESSDPYEWTNLAMKAGFTAKKDELCRWLPKKNQPDIGRQRAPGAEAGSPKKRKSR